MMFFKYKDKRYFLKGRSIREWVGLESEKDGGLKPSGLSTSEIKHIKETLIYFK